MNQEIDPKVRPYFPKCAKAKYLQISSEQMKDRKSMPQTHYSKVKSLMFQNNALVCKETLNSLYSDYDLKAFAREVTILTLFPHPAIVEFKGFEISQNHGRIYLKKMKNGSLGRYSERASKNNQHLTVTQKLIITYGIAAAMEYLHSNEIIHRDLKPSNVLLDENLYPYITDFGTSKNLHSETGQVTFTQTTPIISAPEYMEHPTEFKESLPIDVYSFAVTMYQMWTETKPFYPLEDQEICEKMKAKFRPEFHEVAHVPQPIQELIKRCWDHDPSKRPTFHDIVNELSTSTYRFPQLDNDLFNRYIRLLKPHRPEKARKTNLELAKFYLRPTKEFYDIACKYLRKSIESDNSAEAYFLLAISLLNSESNHATTREAQQSFHTALSMGCPKALELAALYNYGWTDSEFKLIDTPPNMKAAYEYFVQCSKLNNPDTIDATYFLSQMKEIGLGTTKDVRASMKLLKQAADSGYIPAQLSYGLHLFNGQNIAKDLTLSKDYFKRADDQPPPEIKEKFYISRLIDKEIRDQKKARFYYYLLSEKDEDYSPTENSNLYEGDGLTTGIQSEFEDKNDIGTFVTNAFSKILLSAFCDGSLLSVIELGHISEKGCLPTDSPDYFELASKICHSLDTLGFTTPLELTKYHCNDCNMDICEGCAKHCHKGHNIQEIGPESGFRCACGANGLQNHCISEYIGKIPFPKHLFYCETCGVYICKSCCEHCHSGHQVVDCGVFDDMTKSCSCGLNEIPKFECQLVEFLSSDKKCTKTEFGNVETKQRCFYYYSYNHEQKTQKIRYLCQHCLRKIAPLSIAQRPIVIDMGIQEKICSGLK